MMSKELLSTRCVSDVLVVSFHAEDLDETNAADLAEALLELFRAAHHETLHLDFADVRTVSRHVWMEINDLNLFFQEAGWRICLLNLSDTLRDELHALEDPVSSPELQPVS